jgi:hypothetical protein
MNRFDPPYLATWMLEHWMLGSSNNALAGDLLEELRSGRAGRTRAWYWRQVIVAIAINCSREILNYRSVILFAVMWSVASPAWLVLSSNAEVNTRAWGLMWQMDWPWSTICAIALALVTSLAFIWSGMALYLIPRMVATRSFNLRRLIRSLLQALPIFITTSAVPYALSLIFGPGHGLGIDRRTLTPLNEMTDLRTWAMVERFFNLPILLYGLWKAQRLLRKVPEGMLR